MRITHRASGKITIAAVIFRCCRQGVCPRPRPQRALCYRSCRQRLQWLHLLWLPRALAGKDSPRACRGGVRDFDNCVQCHRSDDEDDIKDCHGEREGKREGHVVERTTMAMTEPAIRASSRELTGGGTNLDREQRPGTGELDGVARSHLGGAYRGRDSSFLATGARHDPSGTIGRPRVNDRPGA